MELAPLASARTVRQAESVIRQHLSPAPLVRSYALEKRLGVAPGRQVWIKDYGWTPVGSFKVMGALNWMASHLHELKDRPVTAHSSGNFASGIAYAGMRYNKRVIIVMPESAPQIKFDLTRSFGAEIRTYDIATDHLTGVRDQLTRDIAAQENALPASPYDDDHVIAGNGVGGLEIAQELKRQGRKLSHFVCAVSGGGLMAGHALAIADEFPKAKIVGVEPENANDFQLSLAKHSRTRIPKPSSICDGLLSYDVGERNWPILSELVRESVTLTDFEIKQSMKWIYETHGLRSEPSGAITIASVLSEKIDIEGDGDIVLVLSGRNIDDHVFDRYLGETSVL